MRNELHLTSADNGHEMSVDCWCEPTNMEWVTNKFGIRVLVVDHEDTTLHHRHNVVKGRDLTAASPYYNNHPEAGWITRALNEANPPRQLPPHTPQE